MSLRWSFAMLMLPLVVGCGRTTASPKSNPPPLDKAAPKMVETATFALG